MPVFIASSLFATPLFAFPTQNNSSITSIQERAADFEWTAWGDSYTSGVGSGKYIDGRRCVRYEEAYPVWISDDPGSALPGKGAKGKFNNVLCSGAKTEGVEEFQFYTTGQESGHPNWQFLPRPASGKPTIGTLTVGGDDIDFPGILNNCVMDGFEWPISKGFVPRTCDQQRAFSWSLISQDNDHNKPNTELITKISGLISKILQYGRGASGDKFKLYVTGYGQFFNDQDPGCDDATFARLPDDGNPHTKMTMELRADLNAVSRTLNAAILEAVKRSRGNQLAVKYIDIDEMLTGHRFCEAGVREPDLNNKNLWFWHYPYENGPKMDPVAQYLNSVADKNVHTLSWDPQKTLYTDFVNDFWTKVDEQQLDKAAGVPGNATAEYDLWGDYIGQRARYTRDMAPQPDPGPPPSSAYAPGTRRLHVNEVEIGCELDDGKNLQAEITIWDAKGTQIGHTDKLDDRNFPGINAGASLHMKSKLASDLVVTGEHAGDYVQFSLGSLSWTSRSSKEKSPDAYCNNGGWDPRNGASCSTNGRAFLATGQNAQNQIDCWFKC